MEELTKGWSQHKTKEGKLYYYNAETKKSSWTKPSAPKLPSFRNDGSFMDMVRSMNKTTNNNSVVKSQDTTTDIIDTNNAASASDDTSNKQTDGTVENVPTETTKNEVVEISNDLKRKNDDESTDVQNKGKGKNSRFKPKPQNEKLGAAEEYLRQVQQLQEMDGDSGSTGGKWLVR